MKIEDYCRMMKIDYELLKNCGVFIHDQDTSLVYEIIQSFNNSDIHPGDFSPPRI